MAIPTNRKVTVSSHTLSSLPWLGGILCALLSTNASAMPIMSIGHTDFNTQGIFATVSGNGRACNTSTSICVDTLNFPTVISVPSFDRSWGNLVSARLQIRGEIEVAAKEHLSRPWGGGLLNPCANSSSAIIASSVLSANSSLATIFSASSDPGFDLSQRDGFGLSVEECSPFLAVKGEQSKSNGWINTFDETFTGVALEPFQLGTELSFFSNGSRWLNWERLEHSADPILGLLYNAVFGFPSDSTPCSGVSCAATAALTAARLLEASQGDGHGLGLLYADVHAAAAVNVLMGVEYTYEQRNTIPTIPEPRILALMGLGLVGIGFARKREQI